MAFNADGAAEAPLSVLGGLVTEMAPPNVPEGVSPDNQDVVYAPGEVGSRPGASRIFATPFASSPTGAKSFVNPDPIGTYAGSQNLYLDAGGSLWVELVSVPGVKTLIASGLAPLSYLKSVTAFGREYLAISDGLHGTDVPLQWDGTNLDRVTHDACAASPTVTNMILAGASIASIVRAGNVVTVTTSAAHNLQPGYQAILANIAASPVGTAIVSIVIDNESLAGIATITTSAAHGLVPGNYISLTGITAVGLPGGATVTNITRESGIVTVQTSAPHGLSVGASITIYGCSDGSFNTSSTITAVVTPTAFVIVTGNMTNSSPGASGNVLINWPLPQTETPTYFEVVSCPTATSFQIQFGYSDGTWTTGTVTIPWNGTFFVQSVISPTVFTYQSYGPAISATITGPETSTPFGQVSPGLHQAQCMFLDRSGGISGVSPPLSFEANGGQYLSIANIPLGPPTTVARILAFTGALGADFFYIPVPAQVNGQIVSTATQIDDNTTAAIVLDFSDNTLFGAIGISVPGNNLAAQIVHDGALGFGLFGGRLVTWGQRNRIQNLLSMSFDGGFLSETTIPVGWNVVFGGTGMLAPGHFGLGWQISLAGPLQVGTMSQPAYEDYSGEPITQPNTTYKLRAWFQLGAAVADAVFIAQLSSFATGFSATAEIAVPSTATAGMFLEAEFSAETPDTIPPDLRLTIWASATSAATTLLVDELSIVYAENPYTDRIFNVSYEQNPEGFDGVTGVMGSTDDTQKVMGMAEVRDLGYALTQDPGGRLHEFSDNGVTEPVGWTFRQVETNCGLISCFALAVSQADSGTASGGEQWFAWASSDGARIFGGGTGYKISQEIQPDWTGAKQAGASQWSTATGLNPNALTTAWVLNDPKARVLYFGLPVGTAPAPLRVNPAASLPMGIVITSPALAPQVVLVSNSAQSAGPSKLNSTGLPSISVPVPVPAGSSGPPVVTALPSPSDPLSVIGNYVTFQGQPYIFTAGLSGPPGYWALDVTAPPSIRDTAANLSLYPAANYPVGTVFRATDWNTSWAVQNVNGTLEWIYYNGIMEDVLANIPMTLGLTEKGFLFRASDYLRNWLWTGTVWSFRAAGLIGFAGGLAPGTTLFNVGGPPFGGSGALWQLCDGSTVLVSQENATVVETVMPLIANTWYAR